LWLFVAFVTATYLGVVPKDYLLRIKWGQELCRVLDEIGTKTIGQIDTIMKEL
jgi:hypothetical protein